MRYLLVLLVASMTLAASPAVFASPLVRVSDQSVVRKSSSKTKTKKSKSKKNTTTGTITLSAINSVKHGKTGVTIQATTSKKDLTCDMKIKYANGSTDNIDSVTSDTNKVCTFTVDIAEDSDAVGTASASVTLRDSKGKKLASDKKDFTVR